MKVDELGSEEEMETMEGVDQTVLQSATNNGKYFVFLWTWNIWLLASLCLHLYANTCLIQMNWIDCLLIRFTNIYRVNPTISLLELYYYVYKILLKRISMFILLFFLPDDSLTTRRSARLRSTTPISGTNSGSEDSSQVQQKMTILMFYI